MQVKSAIPKDARSKIDDDVEISMTFRELCRVCEMAAVQNRGLLYMGKNTQSPELGVNLAYAMAQEYINDPKQEDMRKWVGLAVAEQRRMDSSGWGPPPAKQENVMGNFPSVNPACNWGPE